MEMLENAGHVIGVVVGIISGIAAICGLIYAFVKWLQKQNNQSNEITALRERHESDNEAVKDELCVITYTLLAILDGLKQQGCNGEVSKAYKTLQKHINKSAHDQ